MRSTSELPKTAPETALPAAGDSPAVLPTALPTAPCSVVWSRGHAYVLEPVAGRPRWMGVDDRGRAVALSGADLQRRGWTRSCSR